MKSQVFKFAQKGIIFDKPLKKILVGRYIESKYLPQKLIGKLCLPGGQLDFGEDPDVSFIREVKEETGITIKPLLPFYTWTWVYQKEDKQKQIIAVARLGIEESGELSPPIKEGEVKLEKARWLNFNTLDFDNFVEDEIPALSKLKDYIRNNPFILN